MIICQDVLEHTPNPLDIVTSFANHLAPGGVLVVDFLNAPGGENLEVAVEQRESVKAFLRDNLIPLKLIDESRRCGGLYVKGHEQEAARQLVVSNVVPSVGIPAKVVQDRSQLDRALKMVSVNERSSSRS